MVKRLNKGQASTAGGDNERGERGMGSIHIRGGSSTDIITTFNLPGYDYPPYQLGTRVKQGNYNRPSTLRGHVGMWERYRLQFPKLQQYKVTSPLLLQRPWWFKECPASDPWWEFYRMRKSVLGGSMVRENSSEKGLWTGGNTGRMYIIFTIY